MRLSFLAHLVLLALLLPVTASGQDAKGKLTANGKTAELHYASAFEIDSDSEPGYLDVLVVLTDRKLPEEDLRSEDRLAELAHKEGLVALRVVIDPDAKAKSATPYHPAFTALVTTGLIEWTPSAYGETVAGRFSTNGPIAEFRQKWSYDVTFSAPIVLDPEAKTVER